MEQRYQLLPFFGVLRRMARLPQAPLSVRCSRSVSWLSLAERGLQPVQHEQVQELANALTEALGVDARHVVQVIP